MDRSIEELGIITNTKYSEEQLKILQHKGGMCIKACAGSGKALVNGTGVLTPYGYVNIEELSIGDKCYDEKGEVQEVLGVYPQGKKRVYRVIFDDYKEIKCSIDHLWTYIEDTEEIEWKTESLKVIKGLIEEGKSIYLPRTRAIKFEDKQNKIDHKMLADYIWNNDAEIIFYMLEKNREDLNGYVETSVFKRIALFNRLFNKDCRVAISNKELLNFVKYLLDTLGVAYDSTEYGVSLTKSYECEECLLRKIIKIEELEEYSEMTCIKVSSERGLFVIEGGIVTHNTTILTHLLANRIRNSEIDTSKLLCTTYSKAGSNEMEIRLAHLLKQLGIKNKVEVKTLHASYYSVLKYFNLIGNVCSNTQRLKYITSAAREAKISLGDEDLQLLDSLLSFQVNNLLTDRELVNSYVFTFDNITLEQYSAVRAGYNKRKEESGVIDFDDMQLFMYMLLVQQKNQAVIDFCRNMWEYFFIDEFQDVSKIQFAILKELVTDPNKLIVIGDDDQCIYQWRGADPSIILNICAYYDIQNFVLSTNYRCGGEIVKHAAVAIKNNINRSKKDMIPFNEGGKISLIDAGSSNLYDMSKKAYLYIKNRIDNGIDPADIAVLSRNNQHLSLISVMLLKDGIYCQNTPEMRLTNMSMYKDIKSLMYIVEDTQNYQIVKSNLWKIILYLGIKGANIVASIMEDSGCRLSDALGFLLKNYSTYVIEWDGKVRIPEVSKDKIEYLYSRFNSDTERSMKELYDVLTKDIDNDKKFMLIMMQYLSATEFMYKSRDKARIINGLVSYFKELLKEEGFESVKEFMRVIEQFEQGQLDVMGSKVVMSTMHGAKGREWPYVLMFATDNVTFPSFEGINKMIKDGVGSLDISSSIDENRRLHYVAMTRAKKELAIFTDVYDMSVYTLEALGLLDKDDNKMNEHIVAYARGMEITQDLVIKAAHKIYGDNSPYKIEESLYHLNNIKNKELIKEEE